jgi:NACalpha-BTF3-like transcription factor
MNELLELITKTYGLVGLLLAAPFVACYFVWMENKRLTASWEKSFETARTNLQELNDKIVSAQQQRVADAQAITSKLIEIVSEQASVNKETNIALSNLDEKLSILKSK